MVPFEAHTVFRLASIEAGEEVAEIVVRVGKRQVIDVDHGHPFADVPGRVDAIKRHHAERMEMLRDASLALGPATVVALSREVFPKRHWGVMAESETFAHLEHLVHADEAERWADGDQLVYRVSPRAS